MRVLILGAGLIGLSTAYALRCRGYEVTVIDRNDGPGRETSFANGSLLTPSMTEPWNAPGSWRALLASLGRSDAAVQLRLRELPALGSWGITFLRNSRKIYFERNARSNLSLALYSLKMMDSLRQQSQIEYGRAARGSLRIFRDEASLARASAAASRVASQGLNFRRLSQDEIVHLEPALAPIAHLLTGALHYESDETGDAYRFCLALASHAREIGVQFRFRTSVSSLEIASGRVAGVMSGDQRYDADQYIVAAGSYSTLLLRSVGVQIPVRPAKGYSVTLEHSQRRESLAVPVVDDQLHAVVVGLSGVIRVAGTAEFAGYDLTLPQVRIRSLLALLQQVLPLEQFDPATAKSWCGLRPLSADGVPIIGFTSIPNLLVNTGHGHLGWTLAAGSAELLADLICGHQPSIDPAPYALGRFLLQ